jgi:hypothetical protein
VRLATLAACLAAAVASAEPPKFDRTIGKEPKYAGKPAYCLLAFGAEGKGRVWLVQDGDTLYADANGNGDLTDPGDKFAGKKATSGDAAVHTFAVDTLTAGGKTHRGLFLQTLSLATLAGDARYGQFPDVAAAAKKTPTALSARFTIEVECDTLRGSGTDKRAVYAAAHFDHTGVLAWAAAAADAPVLHFDGPLEVAFYNGVPEWTGGKTEENYLVVGTRGSGPGTFAGLGYEAIPENVTAKLAVTFTPKDGSRPPVKELFELKERC